MKVYAAADHTNKRAAYCLKVRGASHILRPATVTVSTPQWLKEAPNHLKNREGDVVGRVFMTSHPTIPLEAFAYCPTTREDANPKVIECKRVHTVNEAISWRESLE